MSNAMGQNRNFLSILEVIQGKGPAPASAPPNSVYGVFPESGC